MNIDLEEAKSQFLKYTKNYDLENENIVRKQLHSLRVMKISKQIAEDLELSKDEISLATLIGLLHDIARFEQYTIYQTYRDIDSVDHGDFGVEILEKDVRKYIETDIYDEIIKKAVKNHNKFKIEEGLTEKEVLFAKIIRDADKLDIFFEAVKMFWKGKEYEVESSTVSENVLEQFANCTTVKREKNQTPIDSVIIMIAFIFDLNFKSSFKILKEEDYINKILNRYNLKDEYTRTKVEEIRKIANEHIDRKIKGE